MAGEFQALRPVSTGPFRLPEAERSGALGCLRPVLEEGGVESAAKEQGSL